MVNESKLNLIKGDEILIKHFIDIAGSSLNTFRYFETRDFDVLDNHKVTILGLLNNTPIAYGHLDEEEDKIWLGIAIAEKFKAKGFGSVIITFLIDFAKNNNINEIYLSVDKVNVMAISMYKKYGFIIYEDIDNSIFIMKKTINEK